MIDRLQAEIGVRILSSADLAGLQESAQITPAIHVLYDGDELMAGEGAQAEQGAVQLIRQRWLVVVTVRNARAIQSGAGARSDAGPLITAALQAVSGWRAGEDYGPLERAVGAPAPLYTAGYAYFPLLFTTVIETIA